MNKGISSREATIWTIMAFALSQGLRLAGNLILARLLLPGDFGMMALIAILMQGLVMFSDVGIGPSIIRSRRGGEPIFLNTAWSIQVVRGSILWLCATLISIPFARFYNAAELSYLIPVACATVFIAGFNSTGIFTENRVLRLGALSVLEIGSQVGGLIVMILWALIDASVWALVVGGLVAAFLKAAGSHLCLPGIRNKFQWDGEAVSELFDFGKWIFVSTALAFCSTQIDRMFLGKLVSLDVLGVYTIGFMWARAPLQLSLAWSSKVFYPLAAKALAGGDVDSRASMVRLRKNLLMVVAPLIAGLIVAMPELIDLLYLPDYQLAGIIGSIFAAGAWLGILTASYGSINMAAGKTQFISLAAATQIVLFIVIVTPLFKTWGAPGIAVAVILSRSGAYLVATIGVVKEKLSMIPFDLLLSLLTAGFAYSIYRLTNSIKDRFQSSIVELVVIASVSCLVSLLVLYFSSRKNAIGSRSS